MEISVVQHVPYENPGYFETLFRECDANIQYLNLFREPVIKDHNFDVLLIMGGPMSIYDEDIYPWLKEEKALVKSAIAGDKIVIGVCLGAQLIADAMGEKIFKNSAKEIGWFPVQKTTQEYLGFLPDFATVFHWHGDTFRTPAGSENLYRSEITENQAFIYDNRVLALQFHLEMKEEGGALLCRNCMDELDGSRYVMSQDEIISGFSNYKNSNHRMLRNLVKWLLNENGW